MHVSKQLAIGILSVLVTMLILVPLATAADIEGKVQSVDARTRVVTLDDGTKLKVMDAAQLRDVKPGANVKASYEEQGGEKVATSIQVQKSGGMPGAGSPGSATPKQ
jgi:Protein of unknown function (DUF1344)